MTDGIGAENLMTVREACRRIQVLHGIKAETMTELVSIGRLKRYKKGEILFLDKEDVNAVFFIVCGTVSLYKVNNCHERRGIFVCGKGAMLNEVILDGKPASVCCEALKDTVVVRFCKKQMMVLMGTDTQLMELVLCSMSNKLRRTYRQISNNSSSFCLNRKIGAKFLKLSKDYGIPTAQGTEIDFDLSVTFLAELVGAKRETVSRQLKPLLQSGLICQEKFRFTVIDREKLLNFVKSRDNCHDKLKA